MQLEPHVRESLLTARKFMHESIRFVIDYILNESHSEENVGKVIAQLELMVQKNGAHNLSARSLVAFCLWNGIGLEKDVSIALKLTQHTARKGCPFAQLNLAMHYFSEEGVRSDTGTKLLQAAKEQNFVPPFSPAYIAWSKKQEEYSSTEGHDETFDCRFGYDGVVR